MIVSRRVVLGIVVSFVVLMLLWFVHVLCLAVALCAVVQFLGLSRRCVVVARCCSGIAVRCYF